MWLVFVYTTSIFNNVSKIYEGSNFFFDKRAQRSSVTLEIKNEQYKTWGHKI
jgi:hypothetical protein